MASSLFESYFPDVRSGDDTIGSLMTNFDRKRVPLSKNKRAERQGKYRYIGATSVMDHVDDYIFDDVYLLLGEDGSVQHDDGTPFLQYTWGKFWANNHTHVLQGNGVSTEWLYLFWKNTNVSSIVTGAVQLKISQTNMNSMKVKIPDKKILNEFQDIITPIFSKIREVSDESDRLIELRDSLLPKLLNGEIELSN